LYNNTGGIVIKVGTEYKKIPPTTNIYKNKKSVKGIGTPVLTYTLLSYGTIRN